MQYSTSEAKDDQLLSVVNGVKVLVQDFVHGEHVDFVLLEHFAHCFIANDIAFVRWIL